MTEIDPFGPMSGRLPGSPQREWEYELGQRLNAYVLKHVHRLEDVGPIGKVLVDGGVDPMLAGELLKNALSEGRVFDSIGSYGEGCRAIWRAVGLAPRERSWAEILGSRGKDE
jgi:hypothetical protein